MTKCTSHGRPAASRAQSLLDAWLVGDVCRVRREVNDMSSAPEPSGSDDEGERLDLLRSVALSMRETPDLFASRSASPRTGSWLDILHHLSADSFREPPSAASANASI